jgi:hypothetical protein
MHVRPWRSTRARFRALGRLAVSAGQAQASSQELPVISAVGEDHRPLPQEFAVKSTFYAAVFCVGAGFALPAAAQTDQGQQQPLGQQQFGQQQFAQQGLTDQRIRQFFAQLERVLQQVARTQDPAALKDTLSQFISGDATMTTIAQLYVGDNHIATTIGQIPEDMLGDALGYAASVLQGRKLVSDYSINIRVRSIRLLPGQNAARVRTVIDESGVFLAPEAAPRVAQRPGQQPGSRQGQADEQVPGQMAQRGQQSQQDGQLSQDGQQKRGMGMGMGQMGMGPMGTGPMGGGQMGMGQMGTGQMGGGQMGMAQGRGGGIAEGIPFQVRSMCIHDVGLEQGHIRIGNSVCRSTMHLQS